MNLLSEIQNAFSGRGMPSALIEDNADLSISERSEAMRFLGRPSSELTSQFLQDNFEFIYWLTPEAFAYYLPGVLCVGVKESRPNLIVNDSIVGMLARSPDRNTIDEFFWLRWSLLTREECEAVQSWLLWLAGSSSGSHDEVLLARAFEMLDWLKTHKN